MSLLREMIVMIGTRGKKGLQHYVVPLHLKIFKKFNQLSMMFF